MAFAEKMIGHQLYTKQTGPTGKPVNKVFIKLILKDISFYSIINMPLGIRVREILFEKRDVFGHHDGQKTWRTCLDRILSRWYGY